MTFSKLTSRSYRKHATHKDQADQNNLHHLSKIINI